MCIADRPSGDYNSETTDDYYYVDDAHRDSPMYNPDDPFMKDYLTFVTSLTSIIFSERYENDSQVQLAIQVKPCVTVCL